MVERSEGATAQPKNCKTGQQQECPRRKRHGGRRFFGEALIRHVVLTEIVEAKAACIKRRHPCNIGWRDIKDRGQASSQWSTASNLNQNTTGLVGQLEIVGYEFIPTFGIWSTSINIRCNHLIAGCRRLVTSKGDSAQATCHIGECEAVEAATLIELFPVEEKERGRGVGTEAKDEADIVIIAACIDTELSLE